MTPPSLSKFVLIKFDYVTPEMRFFIAGLLFDYFNEGGFVLSAKDLSGKYGVSLKTVNSTLKYLVQSGYAKRSNFSVKRGRPIGRYAFTSELKKKLNEPSDWIDFIRTSRFWEQAVINLLQASSTERSTFTVSNRYLICILVLFANELGVVENIPASRIAKILSFSSLRLRSQLGHLVSNQVLLSYTSGVTGKYLFGKSSGIYYLNIDAVAKALGKSLETASFRQVYRERLSSDGDRYSIKSLYRLAQLTERSESEVSKKELMHEEEYQKRWWYSYNRQSFDLVKCFLSDQKMTRVPEYLQAKLEQYIAEYLSIKSMSDEQSEAYADLKKKISEECIPKKWHEDFKARKVFAAEESFTQLTETLFSITEDVASEYTDYFDLSSIRNASFRIASNEDGFTIEAFKHRGKHYEK
ncbi:hypothetical protein F0248_19390 [Vibrio crassostreae]|uniref:hypothetical protein n=1 Tax=Vibrio crassostreae TaxID=246167 RepID=UPI00148C0171|nr:hypothetical protein [Vibrio crassostreae]NOI55229.1 hypothetical protein [Vibrio crassostreae]